MRALNAHLGHFLKMIPYKLMVGCCHLMHDIGAVNVKFDLISCYYWSISDGVLF